MSYYDGISSVGGDNLYTEPRGGLQWHKPYSRVSTPSASSNSLSPERYGSYSGGRSSGYSSLGERFSRLRPTMPKPEMDLSTGDWPEYNLPEFDRERVSELQELHMGAPMGRLRRGLNRGMVEARHSDNPMVRALMRNQTMAGYGEGISNIRAGAHRTGMAEYMPEYQAATQKAGAEFSGGLRRKEMETRLKNLQFQADMNEYNRTMEQTSGNQPQGDGSFSRTGLSPRMSSRMAGLERKKAARDLNPDFPWR